MMNFFISYSRSDEEIVKQLVQDFKSLGYDVWFDKELSGGQSWWDRILNQIRQSDLFVFVLSRKSTNSAACSREYNYAHQLNKRILPILVDDISTNLLPPALTTIHYVDYRDKDRNSLISLVKSLNALPPAQPMPDPLPVPPEVPISYLGNIKKEIETSKVLSFEDQSAILLKLKERLKNKDEAKDVYELLGRFKRRDELYHRIAEQIEEILQAGPAYSQISSPIEKKEPRIQSSANPRTRPQARPQTPQAQTAFQAPPRPQQASSSQTDWMGIVGLILGFFIPVLGIGLGIWGLIRINQSNGKLKGSGWAWAALAVGVFMTFIYLIGIMASAAYNPYGY